jgi:protein dithiol:quinone oxidoreductase
MRLTPRLAFAAMFVTCAGLLALALYLQHEEGLEPCPMCILQRYAFTALGLVALVGAIHGPGRSGSRVYAALVIVFAGVGGFTAARQSYLQHFPQPQLSCMGSDLDFIVGNFPLAQALPKIFAGTGECADVKWRMLGLAIPEWAFVWFVIFTVAALWVAFAKPR